MIIDLEGKEGEWFSFFKSRIDEKGTVIYDDPEPDAGRICIRNLGPYFEKLQAKRKRKYEFVLNPQTRSMERVGYYDEGTPEQIRKERDDAWDYAIVAWENLYDKHDNPIECTRENKLLLMSLPVFDRFIARCIQMISEHGVKEAEILSKNA